MQGHKGYYQLKGEHLKKFLIFRILWSERNETFVLAALPPARPGAAPWKTSCLTWTQVSFLISTWKPSKCLFALVGLGNSFVDNYWSVNVLPQPNKLSIFRPRNGLVRLKLTLIDLHWNEVNHSKRNHLSAVTDNRLPSPIRPLVTISVVEIFWQNLTSKI